MGQIRATSGVIGRFPPATAQEPLIAIALPRAGMGLLGTIAEGYGWAVQHVTGGAAFLRRRATEIADRPSGHLLAGLLPHDEATAAALTGRRKLLLLRDLRSLLVSRLRAERQSKQRSELIPVWHLHDNADQMCLFLGKMGPALFDEVLSVLPWICDPDVVALRFDDLLQSGGEQRQRIDEILTQGLHRLYAPAGPRITIRQPLTAWRFAEYWSDAAEAIFTAFGGPQMNRILGYEHPAFSHRSVQLAAR